MSQRETWLDDRRSIEQNRWRLWQGLIVSDPQVLRASAELTLSPEVRQWLTLGSLAASTGQQGIGWVNGAVRWRDANPDHPAILIIDRLNLPATPSLDYPRQIALLLPLSGRTAAAGSAIQNGFMGAYFSALAGLDEPQSVRVYDVNGSLTERTVVPVGFGQVLGIGYADGDWWLLTKQDETASYRKGLKGRDLPLEGRAVLDLSQPTVSPGCTVTKLRMCLNDRSLSSRIAK